MGGPRSQSWTTAQVGALSLVGLHGCSAMQEPFFLSGSDVLAVD